jgi:hypothetical protein
VRFVDGVVIRARIVSVDPERVKEQVVYEVTEIEHRPGGARPELEVGRHYASDVVEVAAAQIV